MNICMNDLVNLKNPLLRGLPFDMSMHMSKHNVATMKHEHTSHNIPEKTTR